MLIDPTARVTWLKWVQSRGISEVYIAPHASNVPVISIHNYVPGAEGSAVTDQLFCDFVKLADTSYGIDVQLLSSVATDMHWLKNCSAANWKQHAAHGTNKSVLDKRQRQT